MNDFIDADYFDLELDADTTFQIHPGHTDLACAGNMDASYRALRQAEEPTTKAIKEVIEAVQRLLRAPRDLFTLRPGPCGPAPMQCIPGRPGRVLLGALDQVFRHNLRALCPTHASNPYLDLLFEAIEREPALATHHGRWFMTSGAPALALADALNSAACVIHERSNRFEWTRRVDTAARRERDNRQRMSEYLQRVFECRGRILVIRLDLAYAAGFGGGFGSCADAVSLEDAKRHFERFLECLRSEFDHPMYAARREFGVLTGYHFHTLLLLDGHQYRRDILIGKKLGDHWSNAITDGKGRYWNCNARPERYTYPAIGTIEYFDVEKRQHLERLVAAYLTKRDVWLEHVRGGKSFYHGHMPESGPGGRPRSADRARC